ncbi:MAG: hypothetical protein F4Y03_13395, partial [Alphaproteobacteria bacterium]|nr:hypothetical protein [Alphaproteobacteria bacterium]
RRRHGALPGAGGGGEPVEAVRETVLALLRGKPGLPTRAVRAALAERGLIVGYGALYRFLARHGFKGGKAGRRRKPDTGGEPAGPRALAKDLRQRILAAVEAGMSHAEAGRLFRVNPETIARWRGRLR